MFKVFLFSCLNLFISIFLMWHGSFPPEQYLWHHSPTLLSHLCCDSAPTAPLRTASRPRVAEIFVEFLNSFACLLPPLCSGLGFGYLCNRVNFRIQKSKHLCIVSIALLSGMREADRTHVLFLELSVFSFDGYVNNSILPISSERHPCLRVSTFIFLPLVDGELIVPNAFFPNVDG